MVYQTDAWVREQLAHGAHYELARVTIPPGGSYQCDFHEKEQDRWTVVEGIGTFLTEDQKTIVHPGGTIFPSELAAHQVTNVSQVDPLIVIELTLLPGAEHAVHLPE